MNTPWHPFGSPVETKYQNIKNLVSMTKKHEHITPVFFNGTLLTPKRTTHTISQTH